VKVQIVELEPKYVPIIESAVIEESKVDCAVADAVKVLLHSL
jgi:hypothetical protein